LTKPKESIISFWKKERVETFSLKEYFDDETMSVHLKRGFIPKAKRGLPGQFGLEEIGDEPMEKDEIEKSLSRKPLRKQNFPTMDLWRWKKKVQQFCRSDVTGSQSHDHFLKHHRRSQPSVRLLKSGFEDYDLSDKLMERLDETAEGIHMIAGAPGHVNPLSPRHLPATTKKTMKSSNNEKPRDLDVGPTLPSILNSEESMENTGDFLFCQDLTIRHTMKSEKTDDTRSLPLI